MTDGLCSLVPSISVQLQFEVWKNLEKLRAKKSHMLFPSMFANAGWALSFPHKIDGLSLHISRFSFEVRPDLTVLTKYLFLCTLARQFSLLYTLVPKCSGRIYVPSLWITASPVFYTAHFFPLSSVCILLSMGSASLTSAAGL